MILNNFNTKDGWIDDGFLFHRHNNSEFIKPVSSKGLSFNDVHLSEDDLEMYIDLAPFLNPSPYIVPEDMSLTKVVFSILLASWLIMLLSFFNPISAYCLLCF